MKKIMIFGLPGSGKSTWALRLGLQLGIPVYHLDRYFFVEGWKERDPEEFLRILQEFVAQDAWIIDGNSMQSLEVRFAKTDAAFYFRFSRWVCLWRIFKRLFHRHPSIQDRAEGCSEEIHWKLIVYLWRYDKKYKQRIQELRQKYPHVKFHEIRNDVEALQFLNQPAR